MYAVKAEQRSSSNKKLIFFFFAYMLIIPNMLYCSVLSQFVRSLWIISKSETLSDAIELLAKIAPTSHKREQELLLLYILNQNNL